MKRSVRTLAASALATPLAAMALGVAAPAAHADDPIPTFDFSTCPALPQGVSPQSATCVNAVVTSGHFTLGSIDQDLTTPISITMASWPINHKYVYTFGALKSSAFLAKSILFQSPLTNVYAQPEYAGIYKPLDNKFGIQIGIKIHLTNPFIGGTCYIGSDPGGETSPIVLNLTTGTTNPPPPNQPITGSFGGLVAPNVYKLTNVDNAFSVPEAKGCALDWGLVNSLVDSQAGVPSAAGHNTMIYNEYASTKSYDQIQQG